MEATASATSPSITSKPRAEEGDVGRIKKKGRRMEGRDQSSRKLKATPHEAAVISGRRVRVPF